MKNLTLPLLIVTIFFTVSCKKESSNNEKGTELSGTWNYIGGTLSGESSSELSSDDISVKAVMFTNYITKNNTGTISFANNKMVSNNMSYVTEGTVNTKQYMDGALVSDEDSPFNMTMPPSSSTTDYVEVGSDSMYCAGGSFITMDDGGDLQSKPAGIKYRLEGDKLIMTLRSKSETVVTEDGVTQKDKFDVTMIMTLQK